MLHTKYVKICLPVLEKKIFEGFLPYMGLAAILVMEKKTFEIVYDGRTTDGRRTMSIL